MTVMYSGCEYELEYEKINITAKTLAYIEPVQ